MTIFTILLITFVVVLYSFLLIVQSELIFRSKRRLLSYVLIFLLAGGAFWVTFSHPSTLDENIRGIISGLIILSFAMEGKGLTEERIIVNAMDKNGVPYEDVDRVVLYQQGKLVKMNFFRFGLRGPLLKFSAPLDELVDFLAKHLKEGTPIEILVDQNQP